MRRILLLLASCAATVLPAVTHGQTAFNLAEFRTMRDTFKPEPKDFAKARDAKEKDPLVLESRGRSTLDEFKCNKAGMLSTAVWRGKVTYLGTSRGDLEYDGMGILCAPVGTGTVRYPSGAVYEGEIESWVRSSGLTGFGDMEPALRHGQGVLTLPDGSRLTGRWERDGLVQGQYMDAQGVLRGPAQGGPVQIVAEYLSRDVAAIRERFDARAWVSRPFALPDLPPLQRVLESAAQLDRETWRATEFGYFRAEFDEDYAKECRGKRVERLELRDDRGHGAEARIAEYRGPAVGCRPAGFGYIKFTDGTDYYGPVFPGRGNLPVAIGAGLNTVPSGERALNIILGEGRFITLFAWHEAKRELLIGPLTGAGEAGEAQLHILGNRIARGLVRNGDYTGVVDVEQLDSGMAVRGTVGRAEGRAAWQGELTVAFAAPTAIGPAGAYRMRPAATWFFDGPMPAASWTPTAATLALPVNNARGCPVPEVPASFKVWWPTCGTGADGRTVVQAFSRDLAYRLDTAFRGGVQEDQALHQLSGPEALNTTTATWVAARFTDQPQLAPLGEAAHFDAQGQQLYRGTFHGLTPHGAGLCLRPADEGGGAEPCELNLGQRVDQLHHIREQRLALRRDQEAFMQRQEQARAEQQRLAQLEAQRQEAARQAAAQQAAQQQQQKSGGFQWGKFGALVVGAAAGRIDQLDAETQAKFLTGAITDSMAGNTGISGIQAAVPAAPAASTYGGAAAPAAQAPMQTYTLNFSCGPHDGGKSIPIQYRTQACLNRKIEYAKAAACNDMERANSIGLPVCE